MPKITPENRCKSLLLKFGESVKKSKSDAIVLVKVPSSDKTGLILMGKPDTCVTMIYEAIRDNSEIRALIYSAVDYDQKMLLKQKQESQNKSKLITN